jgi:hypothetical protein
MDFRICGVLAIAAFATVAATSQPRAANLITLVSHIPVRGPDGVVADANGNLFGTGGGDIFEIVKTTAGYASDLTILATLDVLHAGPGVSRPAIDASGNLFVMTLSPFLNFNSTLFELVKTAAGYASTPTALVTFADTILQGIPVQIEQVR